MLATVSTFRQAIEQAGLVPPSLIPMGKFIRFPGIGKSDGNTSGWASLSEDGLGGAYGDWASGLSDTWHAQHNYAMTAMERAAHMRRVAEIRRIRQEEEAKQHAEAAQRAQVIWDAATPVTASHSYLTKKQVQPHGLRVDTDHRLIVPVMIGGRMASVQTIDDAGEKRFLHGGKKASGSFTLGNLSEAHTILICEGYATGASLYEASSFSVVVAFDAGNLRPIAEGLRHQSPTATILLCGDNDIRDNETPNTGLDAATAAASAINGILVMPELNGKKCDWNDVHTQRGLNAVREAITTAIQREDATVMERSHAAQFTVAKALNGAAPLDEAELDRLALMPPIEYGQVRKPVADQLGIAVGYLDAAVNGRKKELTPAANVGNGRPLEMQTIVPAEDPVDGALILQTMLDIFAKFLVLPAHAALTIALWIMRAHCDDAFSISPRLAILSPVKRCGKTTLLEIIAKLLPRPLPTSNVTASVIFRVIEKHHPSLLIDEADSFMKENEELRGIVNSGHRRDSATVLRNVGDDHEPRSFSTWSPMVIAAIGTLPDTIEDRSIVVPMRRKQPGEHVQGIRWNSRHGETVKAQFQIVARTLARWSVDHTGRLKDIDPAIPDGLHDRAADNWSPLLAIAHAIGGAWVEHANAAAVALSTSETKTEPRGVELLRDLSELLKADARERVPSQGLCDALALLEERPWGDWRRGKPISPAQLARLLKEFDIQSQSIRTEAGICRGYHRAAFDDAFLRYLAPIPPAQTATDCYTATTPSQSGDNPLFEVLHTPPCSTLENPLNPAPRAECSSVAPWNPQTDLLEEVIHVD